jgi:hypothetical protein
MAAAVGEEITILPLWSVVQSWMMEVLLYGVANPKARPWDSVLLIALIVVAFLIGRICLLQTICVMLLQDRLDHQIVWECH